MSPAGALAARLGLTGRGAAFVFTGLGLVAFGILGRVVPVVQFGALIALLPLVASALTRGPRATLGLTRTLSATELPSGEVLLVTVSVRGHFPRGRSLLLEDSADPSLGGSHRFALNASGQTLTRPNYRVRVGSRGLHDLGPMRLHVVDRFGMVHKVITGEVRDQVLVHPRVVTLDDAVLGGTSLGAGTRHLGSPGAAVDDVIPRDYRPGDEVRRIDWKASARSGALMVRSEESPWRSAVTLVVDVREAAHRGAEPESSLDAALSMVASIGCLALEGGWDLTVRTTDDALVFSGSAMSGVEAEKRTLLRALAIVPTSPTAVPQVAAGQGDPSGSGPLVLVTGHLGATTAALLARLGARSPVRMVIGVAAEQWGEPELARLAAQRERLALGAFRIAGWRVTLLERGQSPADAWSSLAGAAVAETPVEVTGEGPDVDEPVGAGVGAAVGAGVGAAASAPLGGPSPSPGAARAPADPSGRLDP